MQKIIPARNLKVEFRIAPLMVSSFVMMEALANQRKSAHKLWL